MMHCLTFILNKNKRMWQENFFFLPVFIKESFYLNITSSSGQEQTQILIKMQIGANSITSLPFITEFI